MPVIQQHSQEPTDKMFTEYANLQHPRRHHEFFLRSRPYRGELPTVAGFLLYPDTPAKMETTTREAFSFRPVPQDRCKGENVAQDTQQENCCSRPTSSRQTGTGNSRSRDKEPEGEQGNHNQEWGLTEVTHDNTAEMQSQYQNDFPPPSSCRMRRTPALPQPDNIGINPAFRIEFSTGQREAYHSWPIMNPRYAGRLRAASGREANKASKQQSSTC